MSFRVFHCQRTPTVTCTDQKSGHRFGKSVLKVYVWSPPLQTSFPVFSAQICEFKLSCLNLMCAFQLVLRHCWLDRVLTLKKYYLCWNFLRVRTSSPGHLQDIWRTALKLCGPPASNDGAHALVVLAPVWRPQLTVRLGRGRGGIWFASQKSGRDKNKVT